MLSFLIVVLSGRLKHTDWPEHKVNERRRLRPSLPDLRVTGTVSLSKGSPPLAVWLKTFLYGFFFFFEIVLHFVLFFFFKQPENRVEVYPFLNINQLFV